MLRHSKINSRNQFNRRHQMPVFRVNVYARSTRAVNYRHRGGSTTVDIKGTSLMPIDHGQGQDRWQVRPSG